MNMDAGGRFSIVVPALVVLAISIHADALVADAVQPQILAQSPPVARASMDSAPIAVAMVLDHDRMAALRFAHAATNIAGPSNAILVVIGVMLTAAVALWRRRRPRWSAPGQSSLLLLPRTNRRLTAASQKPRIF